MSWIIRRWKQEYGFLTRVFDEHDGRMVSGQSLKERETMSNLGRIRFRKKKEQVEWSRDENVKKLNKEGVRRLI